MNNFRHALHNQGFEIVGSHSDGVICLNSSACQRFLVSGSWDKTLALWDERCPSTNQKTVLMPSKPISMDINDMMIVVATADQMIYLNDLRKSDSFLQKRESPLRHQISSIKWFPNKEGYFGILTFPRICLCFCRGACGDRFC